MVFIIPNTKANVIIKNSINNTENIKPIINNDNSYSLKSITPNYSDKVPLEFELNKELEFLKYIDGRIIYNLSDYQTSQFEDYNIIIEKFSKKGYLDCNFKNNLENFKVPELKQILKDYDLKTTGNKIDLIERIYVNVPENQIKENYNYKIKYTISNAGLDVLSNYFKEKDNYNDHRDELIFQEEVKKDNPYKTMLIQFDDLQNTNEFKSSLSKAILLCHFHGETYKTTIKKFITKNVEELNCPELDKFLENTNGRISNRVKNYEDKLELYIITKINEANYLHLKNKCLDPGPIDIVVNINPDNESCQCSICPTKSKGYTKEDFINNQVPEFPHHYGCMCYVTMGLS